MKFARLLLFCLSLLLCAGSHAATFSGKILSPEDAPIAGATLFAGAVGATKYSEKDGTLKRVTTDAEGGFTFDIELTTNVNFVFVRVLADNFAPEDNIMKPGAKTFKLTAPTTMRGIVKYAKGEPVPDAPVRIVYAPRDMQSLENDLQAGGMMTFVSLMAWTTSLPPIKTISGADGKWEMQSGKTAIFTLDDPRFANAFGMSGMPNVNGLDSSGFITLVAQPGATVKGTLLNEEGKPLKDAYVIGANGIFGSPTVVKEDGTFLIENMPPGPVTLVGFSADADWIIPPLPMTPLESRKVNEAPEWKATKGIEVAGTVINKKTGKPIADVGVSSMIGASVKTSADGKFKVRLAPQMAMVQINHPSYAPLYKQLDKMGNGPTYDAGEIALEPAIKVKGRLLDAKGQPLKNIALLASVKQDANNIMPSMGNAQTDEKGNFEMRLAVGAVTMNIQDKKFEFEAGPYYEFKLDENSAPLELKAKALTPQKATGRVVRPNGKPVAGAMVVAQMTKTKPPEGNFLFSSAEQVSGQTDADGRFVLDIYGTVKDLKISKVEGEQYLIRQRGDGKKEGDAWTVSDTIVALLNATVKGRVLDVKGAPAAGAWVASPESSNFAPIQTDATGNFTLEKLPEGAALIFAAQDMNFARGTAENEKIELKLLPPSRFVLPMRRQLFQQAAKDGIGMIYPYWNSIGSARMLAYALQADGALPYGDISADAANWNQAGSNVLQLLAKSVSSDAEWLRKNGLAALGKIAPDKDEDARFRVEGAMAQALAYGDEKERDTAKQWLDFESKMPDKRDEAIKNAARWFLLAGIAGALDDKRANNFALSALTLADAAGKKAIDDNAKSWGSLLGLGGAKLMANLEAEWPIKARLNAYGGAIDAVAPLDLKKAQGYLETLKQLEEDPEIKKAREAQKNNPQATDQASSENAQRDIVRALAKTDPAAALAMLEKEKGIDWNLREVIARYAWRADKFDVIAKAVAPLKQGLSNAGATARFAAMAEGFDKDLASQLWQKTDERLKEVETRNEQMNGYRDYSELSDAAFYRAPYNPALSRLRLETTWPEAHPDGKDDTRGGRWSHYNLISAMVALDPVRALEMMVESDDNGRRNARAHIVGYLLSDDKERALLNEEYN